jgi:hypothetical protein
MTAPRGATTLVVDYQRARHATALLIAGLVLVACLAAEDPLAERVTPVSVGAAGTVMRSARPLASCPGSRSGRGPWADRQSGAEARGRKPVRTDAA